MITNSQRISNVIERENEFFFVYNDKHKWSIIGSDNSIVLFLYPNKDITLEELAFEVNFDEYKAYVSYRSEDFKSIEATESFKELLKIVKDKIYGVDSILDDILKE